MVDTVQTAIYKMGADTAQYVSAMDAAAAANQKVVASTEQVTVSEERVSIAARSTADAYTRLTARYDPLIRAEQQRAAAMEREARIAEELGIEEARRASTIASINAAYDAQIGRLRGTVANVNVATGSFRSMGAAVQQAGFQVGDFAVQVASGGGVLRPLIQQGTQLISMFGPWGAVIGAAAAVVGALATALWDTSDAAEGARKAQENYTKALDDANRILLTSDEYHKLQQQNLVSETIATFEATQETDKNTLARLKNAQALREQYQAFAQANVGTFDDLSFAGVAQDLTLPSDLTGQIKALEEKIASDAEKLAKLSNPANLFPESPKKPGRGGKSAEEREAERLQREASQRVDQFARELSSLQARLDPVAAATKEYAAAQETLSDAYDRGLLFTDEYYASLDNLAKVYEDRLNPAAAEARRLAEQEAKERARAEADRLQQQLEANEAAAERLTTTLTDGFGEAAASIAKTGFSLQSLGQIGEQVLNSLIDQFIQLAYVNPLNNATGVGGGTAPTLASVGTSIFGAVLGAFGGGMPGPATGSGMGRMYGRFADGGDFTVGGSGGTDSQLVQFKATPGEEVSIRTPQQVSNDNRRSLRSNVTVILPPASNGFGYSPYQIAQRTAERAARTLR